jgi:type IV pilus assembly protein PilB
VGFKDEGFTISDQRLVMKRLGECLIQAGLMTQEDLQQALAEQRRTGERIGAVLVRLNFATEKQVTKALAYQLGLPYVSLTDEPPERSAIVLIPRDIARERVCVAVRRESNLLTVATADPLSPSLAQDLEVLTGHAIKQVVATASDIADSIASGYPPLPIVTLGAGERVGAVAVERTIDSSAVHPTPIGGEESFETTRAPDKGSDAHPSVAVDDLLALVVNRAIASGATDLHIDPRPHGVIVRHRIDGALTEPLDLPQWAHQALADRIAQLAGFDGDKDRSPRDDRVRFTSGDTEVEFRAYRLPTLLGDKFVLRFIGRRKAPLPLDELGLSAGAMEVVRDLLRHSHGLILVAGPSASGKTTTLASLLNAIESDSRSIVTLEGTIEYQIPGANQTQLSETATTSGAALLRAILQQDPDVLLIANLGDGDIVRIAVEAAEKRQLVVAGVHADTPSSAATRLAEAPVERSVIASSLIGVIGQRLVRRLCIACRRQYTPDAETLRLLAIPEASAAEMVLYHAVGCDECHLTGYKGRIAVYEVMQITDRVRRLIAQGSAADLVRATALDDGMVPLNEDGLAKVKAGVTTADELLRVVTAVRDARMPCPGCGGAVAVDFKVCPRCAHRLGGGCHKCGRELQSDWDYCPYCAATAHKKKKKSKEHKTVDLPGSNVAEFKNQNR